MDQFGNDYNNGNNNYGSVPQGDAPQPTYENGIPNPYGNPYDPQPQPDNSESKALAIASMVVGIASVVVCCCISYVGLAAGIVAIVLGVISIKQQRAGKGMAIAGIVLGAVTIVVVIVCLILYYSGAVDSMNEWAEYLQQYES